ncbi:MAG: class I SAM-dependent methyltransferase [archaeon]|nr:class I SAM-dependent methyltransferase [archaeon]MCR4323548.1 class I SAM-dependent methyltransferase [Nanoarchaeota archaeon]
MNQEAVWDLLADHWRLFRNKASPYVKKFLKDSNGKVLDLGCGSGRNFSKRKEIQIYGVDFSKEMLGYAIKKAKKLGIKVKLKKAEAHKTGFKNNYFDAVLLHAVLHCIDSKKGKEEALKEILRVLKPGKKAFISTWGPNAPRINGRTGKTFVPWTIYDKKLKRYTYIYKKEELEKLLKKIGFEIIKSWEDRNINLIVRKPTLS